MNIMKSIIISTALLCATLALADDQLPPGDAGKKPESPAPSKPAKSKAAKSKTAKSKPSTAAPAQPQLPLTPGPAVVNTKNANVRGQAAIGSEVVASLKRGEEVNVIEEVTLKKPKTDEPARWAKIALPPSVGVWVHSDYIDANTKTVKSKRLNLRSGPGENYSVVGRADQGTPVKEIEVKGPWVKIEAPANTYAFVASHLLQPRIAAPGEALAANNSTKPLETAKVETTPPPADAGAITAIPTATDAAPAISAPRTPATAVETDEEIKRVVTREGLVKNSVSIQAPTYYVLTSLDSGKPINYLFSTNIAIKDFKGHRIIVTGEEMLDERWPNTPVIAVDKLEAVP
ncbi:MAG TPA: SH3 domain-containing protein [Candidatus Binatia bacterium]|nr:SH3 domain-containing protein [Candidatus Binatia bacterium]